MCQDLENNEELRLSQNLELYHSSYYGSEHGGAQWRSDAVAQWRSDAVTQWLELRYAMSNLGQFRSPFVSPVHSAV